MIRNLLKREVHKSQTYYNRKKGLIPLLNILSGLCAGFSAYSNFFLLIVLASLFMPYKLAFGVSFLLSIVFDVLQFKLINEIAKDYFNPPKEITSKHFADPITVFLFLIIASVSFMCSLLGTGYRAENAKAATTAAAIDSALIAESAAIDLTALAGVKPATTRAERRNARETANLLTAATAAADATNAATVRRDSLIMKRATIQNNSTDKQQNGFVALLIISQGFLIAFSFAVQHIHASKPAAADTPPPPAHGVNYNSINSDYGVTDQELKTLKNQYANARSIYERSNGENEAARQRMEEKLKLILELGGTPPARRRSS